MLREASPTKRRASLMGKLGGLLRRHHGCEQQTEADVRPVGGSGLQEHAAVTSSTSESPPQLDIDALLPLNKKDSSSTRSTKAVPSLPRPQTFRRQQSEKRDRLLEIPPESRAVSLDRRQRGLSASAVGRSLSPKLVPIPSTSAPNVGKLDEQPSLSPIKESIKEATHETRDQFDHGDGHAPQNDMLNGPEDGPNIDDADFGHEINRDTLHQEYENRWILNLSMHFRDKSNREKFFVTYAETANVWRRVTVSLDYRDALPGSLEQDMSTLHYQRDKSFRIYEAIHESLPDIQYYDTVTNLKLTTEKEDGQLHIHVREDANETIQFPPVSLFQHVRCPLYSESELEFDSHISGFVYRVHVHNELLVKKEIPGPDTVDEFFYEVNALDSLLGCDNVIQLRGLVTDDSGSVVKGLLISYASQGSLVDMIYDYSRKPELRWPRREKWAHQIVQGLSDIHEAGFVQGDFTLSNIVIDSHDNALIIDINRRGCPIGWEPAELGRLIDSGQRIGMHIGVKTDLFQLGMVLWALAEEVDEPERVERPLPPLHDGIPRYYQDIVEICLHDQPQGRWSAARLLRLFPRGAGREPAVQLLEPSHSQLKHSNPSISTHRSDKEYIDPAMAVTIDEVAEQRRRRADTDRSHFTSGQVTYVDAASGKGSGSYRFESSGSWVVGRRGRSPVSSRRRRSSPFGKTVASSATSLSSRGRERSRSKSPVERCVVGREEDCSNEVPISPVRLHGHVPGLGRPEFDLPIENPMGGRVDGNGEVEKDQLGGLVAHKTTPEDTGVSPNPPLHQDFGFDEKMVESLELAQPTQSTYYEAPAVHELAIVDEETTTKKEQLDAPQCSSKPPPTMQEKLNEDPPTNHRITTGETAAISESVPVLGSTEPGIIQAPTPEEIPKPHDPIIKNEVFTEKRDPNNTHESRQLSEATTA